MKKRVLVFLVIIVLLVAISGAVGYVAGYYVEGLQYANDMVVRVNSHILLLEALTLLRLSDSSGIPGLIDAVELNCESHASVIRAYESYSPTDTKERIAEALEEWEKAKTKLKELRSLYLEGKQPDSG